MDRDLELKIAGMRASAAIPMAEFAGEDAAFCELDRFADALVNLWARVRKLERQLAEERDARETRARDIAFEDGQARQKAEHTAKILSGALDAARAARAADERAAKTELQQSLEAHENLCSLFGVQRSLARDVLKVWLARPARVLEVWGQEAYQHAKDVYVVVGGNADELPPPPRAPRAQ